MSGNGDNNVPKTSENNEGGPSCSQELDIQQPSSSSSFVVNVDVHAPVEADLQAPSTSRQNFDEIEVTSVEIISLETSPTSPESENNEASKAAGQRKDTSGKTSITGEIRNLWLGKQLEYKLKLAAIRNKKRMNLSDDAVIDPKILIPKNKVALNRQLSAISEERGSRSSGSGSGSGRSSGHGSGRASVSVSAVPSVSSPGSPPQPMYPPVHRPRGGRLGRFCWRVRHNRISRKDFFSLGTGLFGFGFCLVAGLRISQQRWLLPSIVFATGFILILMACGVFDPLYRRETPLISSRRAQRAEPSLPVVHEQVL